MLKGIESFIPGGKAIKKSLLGGKPSAAAPLKLEDVEIAQKDVNSLQDGVWAASNQAHSRLVKRTGQSAIAQKMEANNQKDQKERSVTKQKRVPPPLPPFPSPPSVYTEAVAAARPITAVATEIIPEPVIVEKTALQFNTLEQHKRRDDELALFAVTVERPHRANNEIIVNTPTAVSVLGYCSQFKDEMPWYKSMQQTVANSSNVTFQKTPVMRRTVLVTFLRMPDTAMPFERACFNLDREPSAHENRVRCIAHRLSEKCLGPGRGFRLREMLFNDQSLKINAALEHNTRAAHNGQPMVDPTIHLTPIPEMCYMCHVWMTTEACLDQKNKSDERERKDMTHQQQQQQQEGNIVTILNRFMVDIDKAGEYDRRKMLVSDDVALGIWGPFPLWNERYYVPVRIAGTNLWGFEETEDLLFRLPR